MKFQDIYKRIKSMWPDVIDISDGKPAGKDGYFFKGLSDINREIESSLSNNDNWGSIGAWSFFQAIHRQARKLHSEGINSLTVSEVSKESIDACIRSNIRHDPEDDTWLKERNEYQGL
jgi:hypothetical protein